MMGCNHFFAFIFIFLFMCKQSFYNKYSCPIFAKKISLEDLRPKVFQRADPFSKSYKSLQPETGDIRGQKTSQRHKDIADGKGLQPSFHIKAHTVGIHPEVGVVHVAAGSGTSSGSQEDQDGIQSQAAGNGSTQGGSGGHGNGAAALDDFQQSRNDKRDQNKGQPGVDDHLGQAGTSSGGFQHST